MNRREFFEQFPSIHLPPPRDKPSADAVLVRYGRRAMATTFEVVLPFSTPQSAEAAESALDLIDRLEDQLTIYRDHSEISKLNARAGLEATTVERNLFDLLVLARQIHNETDGAFDISTGALIKAWGFHVRAGRVPSATERAEVLTRVGMQHITFDPENGTAAFQRPGLEINLGSIGKGYAVDRAIQTLWKEWHIACVLVHGGHSSVFALGGEPGRDAWPVALSDPRDPQRTLGVFHLRDRALGTSSATYQHLLHEGRKLGHILDPRTGWPAEGMLGATVTAPTAAVADALATAFFILGPGPAQAYCQTHPEIGAVLIREEPEPKLIVLGRAQREWASGGILP